MGLVSLCIYFVNVFPVCMLFIFLTSFSVGFLLDFQPFVVKCITFATNFVFVAVFLILLTDFPHSGMFSCLF